MVATATVQHLKVQADRRLVDYDIDDALNIVDLGRPQGAGNKCLPIAQFRSFLAALFRSVGAGGVDAFNIIAATAADGTGATIVKAHALGSAPNAVGDHIFLEVTAEQIHEVLPTATHVGVSVELVTAGDEAVVYFERGDPLHARDALTADFIS